MHVIRRKRETQLGGRCEAIARVEADGDTIVVVHRVAIHHLAGAIRGEVQLDVGITHRKRGVSGRTMPADDGTPDALPILTVEELNAIGAMPRTGE